MSVFTETPTNAVEPFPFLCYNYNKYNKKNATEVFP